MNHHLRIITINLCNEYPGKKDGLLTRWINILTKTKGDVIFLQEIQSYNLEKLISKLNMKILDINNSDNTCVLINPYKLKIIDNKHIKLRSDTDKMRPIYVSCIHLTDIPSVVHHIDGISYKSTQKIPLDYSLDKVLKLCAKNRLPVIKEELKNIKKTDRSILGGDFNEPSHLDLDIKLPVSKELYKKGFVDTYRYINKDSGYTWPTGSLYKKEPNMRVDMIYTKNIKIMDSKTYDSNKWISDHKMVITDLVL
jgi:endonuclease/exonuclease/phosphatase family metal-dependent hydrolase